MPIQEILIIGLGLYFQRFGANRKQFDHGILVDNLMSNIALELKNKTERVDPTLQDVNPKVYI